MSSAIEQFAFARFLKFWRSVHEISQEELASRLGSSPRHVSRLENGISRPSESIIQDIGLALNLGKRDLNHLLIAAGYAAMEEKVDFNAPEMKWLRKAMILTLRSLDPYPASVMDSSANILMVNRGWLGFYGKTLSSNDMEGVSNFYDFLFSRRGVGKLVNNWENTLSVILMSMQQVALFSNKPEDQITLDRLIAHPAVPDDWRKRGAKLEPMASFRVQADFEGVLATFYNVSTNVGALGSNAFVSEPRLTINTLYPEDDNVDLSGLVDGVPDHPLLFY
ncbi:MAG: transcriptional regulator with XRE-family HTH domain [Zhongshania sp.]|jgi:transcriptional regulator with XRE-family HTH domain